MPNNTLKRKDTNEVVELHVGLQWLDEFDWSDLAQAPPRRTRGGALAMQQSQKLSGRPVTLGGEHAMLTRGLFKKLQAWSAVPKLQMTLTLNNAVPTRTLNVAFRTHDGAIDCEPLLYEVPETDGELYTGEIRLMII